MMPDNYLLVNEVYKAVQGEGLNIGKPVIFIRLFGCNLNCSWCDSTYAWGEGKEFKKMNFKELADLVEQEEGDIPCNHFVITGGEPLLQQKKLVEFLRYYRICKQLKINQLKVDFETNGTVEPLKQTVACANLFCISPKLSNSGIEYDKRIKDSLYIYGGLANLDKAILKFVITKIEDLEEVQALEEKYNIPRCMIYLMPEGVTREKIIERTPDIIEICKKYNYNFTTRLHVLAYGLKRKV